MKGKYNSHFQFWYVRAYRAAIRAMIQGLARWEPRSASANGYSIIIGGLASLPMLLLANLRCLSRLDLTNVAEVIIVLDGDPELDLERQVRNEFDFKCRILRYSRVQRHVVRSIRWPWVNSRLSWALGIAATTTRYAVLHDLDAMPIKEDFMESRYKAICGSGHEYLGIRHYSGLGVECGDGLLTTFELFFDVDFVRRTFRPIDLFNQVAFWRGRYVEFDTFIFAQAGCGQKDIMPAELESLVHPSQMICQYTYHLTGDRRLPKSTNNLMVLPYFFALGGDDQLMRELTTAMRIGENDQLMLFGRLIDIWLLTDAYVAWIEKQIRHLDQAIYGAVRRPVNEYLEAMVRYCSRGCRDGESAAGGSLRRGVGVVTEQRVKSQFDGHER